MKIIFTIGLACSLLAMYQDAQAGELDWAIAVLVCSMLNMNALLTAIGAKDA